MPGREHCPSNPHFYSWIKELRDSAREKDNKSCHSYSRAMKAICQYPIPLRSGEEAKCIQHIGDKMARIIDKKAVQFYKERGYRDSEIQHFMISCSLEKLPTIKEKMSKEVVTKSRKRRKVSSSSTNNHAAESRTSDGVRGGRSSREKPSSPIRNGESSPTRNGESSPTRNGESSRTKNGESSSNVLQQFNDILKQIEGKTTSNMNQKAGNIVPRKGREPDSKVQPSSSRIQAQDPNSVPVANPITILDSDHEEAPSGDWVDAVPSTGPWRYCYLTETNQETTSRSEAAFLEQNDLTGLWMKAKTYTSTLSASDKLYVEDPKKDNVTSPSDHVTSSDPRYITVFIESTYCDLKAPGLPKLRRVKNRRTVTKTKPDKLPSPSHAPVSVTSPSQAPVTSPPPVLTESPKPLKRQPLPDISDSEEEAEKEEVEEAEASFEEYSWLNDDRLNQVLKSGVLRQPAISPNKPCSSSSNPPAMMEKDTPVLFTFQPFSFKVVLCVDNAEVNTKKQQMLLQELNKNGVEHVVRKLQVGDFVWLAQDKTSDREVVLDVVVERKRMDDLAQSITGGRFVEQKLRLKSCGLSQKVYLVETKASYLSLPETSLNQAVVNTQVIDGFTIKKTQDIKETAGYLTILTRYLQNKYQGKELSGISEPDRTSRRSLLTFQAFSQHSIKNRVFTVREVWLKQLCRIPKISQDKAEAIVEVFPTPRDMMTSLLRHPNPEGIISDIKFGVGQRKIGIAASRMVAGLFSGNPLH